MTREPTDMDDFERSLLEAARLEAPPPRAATERAWQRFSATGGRLALSVAGKASPAWLTSANLSWLVTGLVAGSVATAALMPSRDEAPAPAARPSVQAAAPPAVAPDGLSPDGMPSEPPRPTSPPAADSAPALPTHPPAAVSAPALRTRKETAAIRRAPRATAVSAAARGTTAAARGRAPGLEAEVRALDAIQGALSAGRHADALAAVEAFHRDFPRAQLAADAEGLAIDALVARGDTVAAAERAAQFLERYPGDPHAARFAPLAGQAR